MPDPGPDPMYPCHETGIITALCKILAVHPSGSLYRMSLQLYSDSFAYCGLWPLVVMNTFCPRRKEFTWVKFTWSFWWVSLPLVHSWYLYKSNFFLVSLEQPNKTGIGILVRLLKLSALFVRQRCKVALSTQNKHGGIHTKVESCGIR